MASVAIPNQSYLILLPDKGVEPLLKDVKSRIYKALNHQVVVQMKRERNDEETPYSELVLHLDCDFGSLDHQRIISGCCDRNIFEGIGESRLSFDNAFSFSSVNFRNEKINVGSFSFGSLVGLNTFFEHYNSAWSKNSETKRVTQLRVDFAHDFFKIVVSFIIADKQFTKESFSGKSHRLHQLDITYSSIQTILIKEKTGEKKSSRNFDIYLQVGLAPTVKKIEKRSDQKKNDSHWKQKRDQRDDRSDNDSEDSDKNEYQYLSSQDQGYQTRFQRVTCFGCDSDRDDVDSSRGKVGDKIAPTSAPTNDIVKKKNKKKKKPNESAPKDKITNSNARTPITTKSVDSEAFCSSKTIGMCRTIKLEVLGEASWEAIEQLVNSCNSQAKVFFTPMNTVEIRKVPSNPTLPSQYFNCFYALKCIVSASYIIPDELCLRNELREINKMLTTMAEDNDRALEQALFDIYRCLDKGCVVKFKRALLELFEKYKYHDAAGKSKADITNRMVEMRRAILTPTRFVFLPPVPQLKSSLLRKCDTDYAMRVTVRDDNFDQLTFTLCGSKENKKKFLQKYIGNRLAAGFKIAERCYEFLGSSTSQLREHGSFFYAQDKEGRTAQTLRESVGDIRAVNNVPKFMARMGQSLSQAMTRIVLEKQFVEGPVPDTTIRTRFGLQYNFTDGVGKISPCMAQLVYQALGLDPEDKPSAFQIRYGGCKGMLVVDPTIKEKKVIFRKSQWKFDSTQESLEILKVSRPQKAFLNRPFITILEQMGIKPDAMLELQSNALNSLIGSLTESADAMKILKERASLRLPYSRLHYCGIDLSSEAFFKPMVMFLYRQAIGELKHKARVQIPFDSSRTMFGVVDETNSLKYGQVFFQYSDITVEGSVSRKATIYEGTVLVTKNPCMHPGDVRKFEAVKDVPALHHIKDCLVFPATGPRPHPDEMAGSDLDGDEYVVIWYEKLIFERANHEAMDYSNDITPVTNDDIKVTDMTEFMCQYILDDCVGLIASAHLALADRESIFCPKLTTIAKKYSVTLDFAKSGKPEELNWKERPTIYPDFMEKYSEKITYLSENTLGQLYRNCKRIDLVSEILDDNVEVEMDQDLIYPGWEEYREDAQEALDEYINLLMMPAKMFNLTKEGEIMSGAIKKIEKSFQGKNAKENMDLALDCIVPNVFKKCRQRFMQEFLEKLDPLPNTAKPKSKREKDVANKFVEAHFIKASNPTNPTIENHNVLEQMLKKASAWYVVAYQAKMSNTSTCLGLPWTVAELMGLLKAGSVLRKGKSVPSIERKMQLFINDFDDKSQSDDASDEVDDLGKESRTFKLARTVVLKWLKQYENFLLIRGFQSEMHYVLNILHDIAVKNPQANLRALLLMYFKHLSNLCYFSGVKGSMNPQRDRELGMLALVTLSCIATCGKLGLAADDPNSSVAVKMGYLTKNFREHVVFPLKIGESYSQNIKKDKTFRAVLIRNENIAKGLLKRMSRVQNIDLEFRPYGSKSDYMVVLTVYGRLWAIESLKEFIIQPNFATILMRGIKQELDYYEAESDDDSDDY